MPLYVVSHYTPLTNEQKDALAIAITKTHTTLFNAAAIFVNVRFEDISGVSCYVGGKPKLTNSIMAHVRTGAARPRSAYNELCADLLALWSSIVPQTEPAHQSKSKLDTIFVLGGLIAGYEQGVAKPEPGNDAKWFEEHFAEFERRASEGEEAMVELIEQFKGSGEFSVG